jgi:hypothetical protein
MVADLIAALGNGGTNDGLVLHGGPPDGDGLELVAPVTNPMPLTLDSLR